MSLLCNKCRVIQFNDADYDGTVNVWTNGESYFAPKDDGDITQCLFLDYDLKDVVPDLPVLSQSAENGCALCLLIKTEVTKFLQGVELEHADFFIHKLCYAMQKHVVDEPPYRPRLHALFVFFRILNRTSGEEDVSWTLRLEIQAEPTDPCAQWLSIPRQPIQENILSKAGMQRLNELMETISEIPSLPPAIDDQDLPTRLIDTGLRGPGIENEEPRLVVTADYPPLQNIDGDQRYVALSYCWGPPEKAKLQLTTQTSTLDDRLRQIPFSTFPKTHQDAIQLCVFLGVRYVWIDSLCIVQDDKSDWEREAQQMGSVYANAFLTVCAAQGDSCLDGFLTRRYPSNSVEVSFASTLNPSVSGCYSIFASPREYATVLPLIIGEEFNKHLGFSLLGMYDPYSYDKECNWNERGWTFQEVVLSQRSLLFGERMVHVCSGDELIQSEEAIHTTAPEEVCDSLTEFLSDVLEEDSVEFAKSMFSKWRELVSEYSHRSFTYQNDILPALSALAKIWVERVGGNYLAGIFSSDLNQGLLWSLDGRETVTKYLSSVTEETYTAPSWSWASLPEGGVTWFFEGKTTYKPEFKLLESHITLDGLNPYGRVRAGYLVLSTKLCGIPSTRMRHKPRWWGPVIPYELLADDGTVLGHVRPDWRLDSVPSDEDSEKGEICDEGPVDQLFMVLISSKFPNDDGGESEPDDIHHQDLLVGLLVLPTSTPGEYRRAGVFFTEASGQCGRRFWDQCSTQEVKLV